MVAPDPDVLPAWAHRAAFVNSDGRAKRDDDLRLCRTEAERKAAECRNQWTFHRLPFFAFKTHGERASMTTDSGAVRTIAVFQ